MMKHTHLKYFSVDPRSGYWSSKETKNSIGRIYLINIMVQYLKNKFNHVVEEMRFVLHITSMLFITLLESFVCSTKHCRSLPTSALACGVNIDKM